MSGFARAQFYVQDKRARLLVTRRRPAFLLKLTDYPIRFGWFSCIFHCIFSCSMRQCERVVNKVMVNDFVLMSSVV